MRENTHISGHVEQDLKKLSYQRARAWRNMSLPPPLRKELDHLWDNEEEMIERFGTELVFGTGGARARMGVGTSRINDITLCKITQGLASCLHKRYDSPKAVICYDSRHHSEAFAEKTAQVLLSCGVEAHLFRSLRPTPMLSWTVHHLKAQAGIMITASHNPKDYNGYKVYDNNGAQIVGVAAQHLVEEVRASSLSSSFSKTSASLHYIEQGLDSAYLNALNASMAPYRLPSAETGALRVVYTSLHGAGGTVVPQWLRQQGFEVCEVEAQATPDGSFPTVKSPNPEEKEAMSLALEKAQQVDADLLLGTDPDGDRVGVGTRTHEGYQHLDGNQVASLLLYYVLSQLNEKKSLPKNAFVVKTLVTTRLFQTLAQHFGVNCYNTLTGFKYIAEQMELRPNETFLMGAEESCGYLLNGSSVKDKDAVQACGILSHMCLWAKQKGKNLCDVLNEIYGQFGLYQDRLQTFTFEGKKGKEKIARLMDTFRQKLPPTLLDEPVLQTKDYLLPDHGLPTSNVLQFLGANGNLLSVRPSGTEPKIKFYLEAKTQPHSLLKRPEQHLFLKRKLDGWEENLRKYMESA